MDGAGIPSRLMLEDDRNVCLWHTSEEEDNLEELPDEQDQVVVLLGGRTPVLNERHVGMLREDRSIENGLPSVLQVPRWSKKGRTANSIPASSSMSDNSRTNVPLRALTG